MHKKKHTQTNAWNKYIIDAKNVLKNNKRKLKEKMHTHCKQKTAAKSHKTPGNCFVFTYRFFKVLVFKKKYRKNNNIPTAEKIHTLQTNRAQTAYKFQCHFVRPTPNQIADKFVRLHFKDVVFTCLLLSMVIREIMSLCPFFHAPRQNPN
jgi:hypothetical protein